MSDAKTVEPFRPITIEDQHGSKWVFEPQSDITPLESALVTQLMVRLVMTVWHGPVDWPTYVEDHKLGRHFTQLRPLLTEAKLAHERSTLVEGHPRLDAARVEYIAEHDAPRVPYNGDMVPWRKGYRMVVIDGMPVPDGFVPATPDNVSRIQEELAAAGGVR